MITYIILGAGLALAISGVAMWFAYKYEDKLMWTPIKGM